ncbi:hypothetical protein [Oceaniovalibus sp. ACAM 378]|uniref:hypothetical protein n=1 Tax=Oceaniovalibus sp. ACAM 378 TaxID=2599923 RepID=UPI0016527D87|nr:hypothetical protein [Oceaniovalibus sp. ACAM 378]
MTQSAIAALMLALLSGQADAAGCRVLDGALMCDPMPSPRPGNPVTKDATPVTFEQ